MAAMTAKPRHIMPKGAAFNDRSLLTSITNTPKKDTINPITFSKESLSFKKKKAAMGEKTGIVAMMTALMVAEVFLSPKFSPKK